MCMLDKLKEQAKIDLKIDRTELVDESLKTPIIHSKWLSLHADLKAKARKLQYEFDVKYKERWLYYNGKANPCVYKAEPFDLKILKSDTGVFLGSDDKLLEIKNKLEEIKDLIAFVEGVIGEINKRSFHIKNAIDVLRWENGG